LFGWHVHEKAVLLVLIPLRYLFKFFTSLNLRNKSSNSLLAAERQAYFRTFVLASVAGVFSLFPLIFTPSGVCRILFPLIRFSHNCCLYIESVIKVIYSIIWIAVIYVPLNRRVYE
jgi:alpha-1,3-glucosyltransferase